MQECNFAHQLWPILKHEYLYNTDQWSRVETCQAFFQVNLYTVAASRLK